MLQLNFKEWHGKKKHLNPTGIGYNNILVCRISCTWLSAADSVAASQPQ